MVLVLIDVINRLDFEGGEKLVEFALPMARRIVALKKRAKASGIPTIYVNDNFGRWKSISRLSLIDAYPMIPRDAAWWSCCDPRLTITLC